MLNLLKLDNWEDTVPMAYYLTPLKSAIKTMREEVLQMRKRGPNRCKYYVEHNELMHTHIITMVAKDVTAQWLMGDKLKNDQLCFLYSVVKIIYQSPLKSKLMNKDLILVEEVIPKLACFRALMKIRDILIQKLEEKQTATKETEPENEGEEKVTEPAPEEEQKSVIKSPK